MRHVRRDQLAVWMLCSVIGMALPCMLSLEFIRQQDVKESDDKIILHRPRIVETPMTPLAAPSLRSIDAGDIAQAR